MTDADIIDKKSTANGAFMKTAIFWKTPNHTIVLSEESPIEPPLNIADYSGSHVQMWENVKRQYPDLALTEYDEFPRGRLI